MILQALYHHYDRLAQDGSAAVAPLGYSRQKVSFCVMLNPDGTLHSFEPMTAQDEKSKSRGRPQELVVPGQSKPPGQGINPCFLWDNATYMLGVPHPDHDEAWAQTRFEAFHDRHLKLQSLIQDSQFAAVCQFLQSWSPQDISQHESLQSPELIRNFGVFRIRGQAEFVHQRPAVENYWRQEINQQSTKEDADCQCLITGRQAALARLHEPKIKGVIGAQTSGALLVSFNLDAFTSYGKDQSYNAPVSEDAAFKYATALNYLLADREHCVVLGDTTCVFWTEKPHPIEPVFQATLADDFWAGVKDAQAQQSESETQLAVRAFFERAREGKADDLAHELEDPQAPFYALGLSPNASRLSVRFWLASTAGEMAKRLAEHVENLHITGPPTDGPPLTLRRIVDETAPPKNGWPDRDKVAPQLAGDLARAVLTGLPYPHSLAAAIISRIRAEGFVDREKRKDWRDAQHRRAATLKAWLIRNHRLEVPVSLDESRTDAPYLLGRLFAAYEKIQRDAQGEKLNRTVKDSYFSAASATPASVFPRLIKLSQHHLSKLKADKPGLAVHREKLVGQICAGLTGFPTHLSLQEQGLFAIGYYHQIQNLYTSKTDHETSISQETPDA